MPRNPTDRSKLIRFGPYAPPRAQIGDEIQCEIRGKLIVVDWSDRPGIMWPRGRTTGRHALVVCGDLIRAMDRECEEAVGAHWGVVAQTVSNWRRQLGMRGPTEGALAVLAEKAQAQMTGKPAHPSVKAGLLRAAQRPKSRRWKNMLAARNKLRAIDAGAISTVNDASRLREMLELRASGATLAEIAKHFGLTHQAVAHTVNNATTRTERSRQHQYASPRCTCGAYSLTYARQIAHVCPQGSQ